MANKKFLAGMLTAVVLWGLFLTGCPQNTDDEDPPAPPVDYSKDVTIYVKKPAEWTKLYAYVWDDSEKEYNGAAPGTELTSLENGFYSYKAKGEYGYLNFRFSNGGTSSSFDIEGVDTTTYYESADAVYTPDTSKVIFRESAAATLAASRFYSGAKALNTVTLNWDPVPGVDGYVLYYVVESATGADVWYFTTALGAAETGFVDINHGQYFFPETEYKWKLHAVKYKEDLNGLDTLVDTVVYVPEAEYAAFCDTVSN